MNTTEYNGYPNRITWLVMLHFNLVYFDDLEYAKAYIDELMDSIDSLFIEDVLNRIELDIDWDFLSDWLVEDDEE